MQKTYEKPTLTRAASLNRITAYGASYCYRYHDGHSAVTVQEIPEECREGSS